MGESNLYQGKSRSELIEALKTATIAGKKLLAYLADEEVVTRQVFGSRAEQIKDYGVSDMEMRLIRLRRAIEHAVGNQAHDQIDLTALGDFPTTLAGLQMNHEHMRDIDRDDADPNGITGLIKAAHHFPSSEEFSKNAKIEAAKEEACIRDLQQLEQLLVAYCHASSIDVGRGRGRG